MLFRRGVVVMFLASCTGPAGDPGPQGPAGADGSGTTGTASINVITPRHGFLGRTGEVEISGDNTSFDASTTVDFGAGITVGGVQLVSPTQIVATINIAENATVGDRDVTVHAGATTLVATTGFSVDPSLAISISGGPLLQGDLAYLTLYDLDVVPFAGSPQPISFAGGVMVPIGTSTSLGIDYMALIDVSATVGGRSLVIDNPDVAKTKFVSDPADFFIGARTPTAITLPYSSSVVFDTRSKVFTVQTSTLGILSAHATGVGAQLNPAGVISVGNPEYQEDLGGPASGLAAVTRATSTTRNILIGGNASTGNDAAHTLTLDVIHTPVAALTPESATAHPYASPQVVSSPSIVDGTLSTSLEQDAYEISVPAGGSVEVTVASLAKTVAITTVTPTVSNQVLFLGSTSYHWTSAYPSAQPFKLFVAGVGDTTSYTVSFRLY